MKLVSVCVTDVFCASRSSDHFTSCVHCTRSHVQQHPVTSSDDHQLTSHWTLYIIIHALICIPIIPISAFSCIVFASIVWTIVRGLSRIIVQIDIVRLLSCETPEGRHLGFVQNGRHRWSPAWLPREIGSR